MIRHIINKELGVYDLFGSYYERDSFTSIFKPTMSKSNRGPIWYSLCNNFNFEFTNTLYQTGV
jgi:hypothetical protein